MRESLMYGSVRGARGNSRPYRDDQAIILGCCDAPVTSATSHFRQIKPLRMLSACPLRTKSGCEQSQQGSRRGRDASYLASPAQIRT